MSSEESQNRHLLRTYYGDIVERANFDKLSNYFNENYTAHFPGKDLNLNGLKEMLSSMHMNLRNINVEIENDKFCDGMLCHEILFQGNRVDDMSPVEWRSSSKWKIENGKISESWPTTSISYDQIMTTIGKKMAKAEADQPKEQKALPQAAK